MLAQRNFHVFKSGARHFLFLSEPVAIFSIDADTFRVLSRAESGDVPGAGADGQRMREATSFIERYLERARPAKPLRAPSDVTERVVALYLFVSQECNLTCRYCYGEAGEYGRRGRMNESVMQSAFERFFADGQDQGRQFITFFGGEPLMNFPLMEKTASLARAYRRDRKADVSLCIVTNGTLYSPQIHSFFRESISDATFSLDGPRDLNDAQRVAKTGEGIHDRIAENIRKLTEDAPFNWAFRSIVTRDGCERVEEIYRHLESFGPNGIGIVDVDAPRDSPLHIDDLRYGRFLEQIVAINRRALSDLVDGRQAVAFEYPFYVLYHFVSRRHALYHCNAGANLLAVTAEGDVYPCHRFVGLEQFRMGNVSDPGLAQSERYREVRNLFIEATVDHREGCRDCWARYLCGGSCAKHSFAEHGRVEPPASRHCRYIKTVIEAMLPDLAELIEIPERRQKLVDRLGAALGRTSASPAMGAPHVA
jgi:uncharacterized protein